MSYEVWVREALRVMADSPPETMEPVADILGIMDSCLLRVHQAELRGAPSNSPFIRMMAVKLGRTAMDGWKKWVEENGGTGCSIGYMVEEVASTLVAKHTDYGNASLIRFGFSGFVVKADMKVSRLKNLLGKAGAPANEPITDTWLDIVGYATLLYMYTMDQIK